MEHIYEYDRYIKEIIRDIPDVIKTVEILEVNEKSDFYDLVTEVDKAVESFLTEKILEKFPGHTILGEETYEENKVYDKSNLWVIDPIDGTTNFVKQGSDFCTIISYFEDGVPQLAYIYKTDRDELFSAMRGEGVYLNDVKLNPIENKPLREVLVSTDIRRMYGSDIFDKLARNSFGVRSVGSSGLDGVKVAEGKLGAYINYKGGPWDFSPFYLISEEMGLHFSTIEGEEVSLDNYSNFIICTKDIYKELME